MRSFDGTLDSFSSDESRYSTHSSPGLSPWPSTSHCSPLTAAAAAAAAASPPALAPADQVRFELQQLLAEITPVLQRLMQAGADAINSPDFYRGRDLCVQYRKLQLSLQTAAPSPTLMHRVPDRNAYTSAWLHSQSAGHSSNGFGQSLDHATAMAGPTLEMQHLLAAFSRLTTAAT